MNDQLPADLMVVALGGNAIISEKDAGRIEEQFERSAQTAEHLGAMILAGRPLVITHGNGPIVGNILIRNEAARDRIPPMPLDICGADSQGGIGYMLQQTLGNELRRRGLERSVVTVVTQVVVDPEDPAFRHPTKPIGPFYGRREAEELARTKGWVIREDAGRGYRRVVPSPAPREIVEREVIADLVAAGVIVIAVGGGGIPVTRLPDGRLRGVEAVVDKDRAAAVLARELRARRMMILTAVPTVFRGFGGERPQPLRLLFAEEARRMLAAGEFPPGSMGPKIESAVEFLEGGGEDVIITSLEGAQRALVGESGTRIVREPPAPPLDGGPVS